MADATLPQSTQSPSWLDKPIAPSWQRLAAFAAHWEVLAYLALVTVGFILRIWGVGDRAMHHDESLHAYYAWKLFVGQGYTYDPLMHGPFQFEFVPLFYLLFGANEFSARLLAVLLGTALVGLPYFLRPYLTSVGAIFAATMLAISPAFVYFSRFIRDDIYLACFSLGLFICLVKYMELHEQKYMYVAAACMAFAVASMEAAYLTFFIFGSFLAFEALREFLARREGPVIAALRATSLDTWLTALSIFVVLTVLMYSTFFTNPTGVWDSQHSITSPDRKDILGGLTYWQAQHGVSRGDQPWFYYLLVMPLYEQLAVFFGLAGLVYCSVRKSLTTTFLVWWAVMGLGLYSWAGEKMPWLTIHIALPFILLAGLAIGVALSSKRRWLLVASTSIFAALLALEVHSTFALNFRDAADPTEMLIYVQSSPDVPRVASEIDTLSHRLTGGTALQIGLDDVDLGGWPFTWYLRDYHNVTETGTFKGPVCGGKYCQAMIVLGPEFDQNSAALLKHYVAQKYRWNWWFPEQYKQWFPQHVGTIPLSLGGHGSIDSAPIGTPADWSRLWNWLVYRQPFAERDARWLYFLVRRDLVPNSKYFSTSPSVGGPTAPAPSTGFATRSLPASVEVTAGGQGLLSGPRDAAIAPNGNIYVGDTKNHRVVQFNSQGAEVRVFGTVGTGLGQFNQLDSPQGLAVGTNGDVYVTDTWNHRIQVFSGSGRFLRSWGDGLSANPGRFYGPRSLALGPSGKVYVADTGNKRIQVFTRNGVYLTSWGSAGTGPGQFQEPSAVAVTRSGEVYVADFWNQRIQVFSSNGTYLRSWPVPDWTPQSYDEPYLAVNPRTGTVYASDPQQQKVLAFTATGRLLGAFGSSTFSLPVGVAVGSGNRVLVTDATTGRVAVFRVGRGRGSIGPPPPARVTPSRRVPKP